MNERGWSWVGAKSTGSSHLRSGSACDDFAACVELGTAHGSLLIPVVSDGAGSARYSAIGSKISCRVFVNSAARYFGSGGSLDGLSEEVIYDWVDEIRDRISACARQRGATARDFAATLVGALVSETRCLFCHVGDGAAVYNLNNDDNWIVASWPTQGEYASTTYFITDDPAPKLRLVSVDETVGKLALFTDGIERLVLNFGSRTAHGPFFENMMRPLANASAGRNRKLSTELRQFLDSSSVCDRTDDDKTLVLAKRVTNRNGTATHSH